EDFQQYLAGDIPPPLTEADTVMRHDAAWATAAATYTQVKRDADALAERLEAARQALVALAQHPKEQGAGVSVTRFWKQGNVDYKKVPQLQGLDLSPYRGMARQEVRIVLS
ncbi:MAG TPA: hypothetical protein VGE47_01570, partial [Burkholderiaceae bacterium]